MKKNRARMELSAIFITSALLLLSVGSLIGKAATAEAPEPYPNLYVTPAEISSPGEKTVYLTFDDGPSKNTEKVLDVLREKEAPSTFFVTAQNIGEDYAPLMLQRMVDEGHTIALHSYSHRVNELYRSVDSYLADVSKLNDYLLDTLGVQPDILRFAGGSATVNAAPSVMKGIIGAITERGYRYYDWDVVSGDDTPHAQPVDGLVRKVVNGVQKAGKDQVVVLLHDNPAATTTPQATSEIIDALRAEGWIFAALDGSVEPVHTKTERFQLDE